MNFAFTEQQQAIRESVARLAADALAPRYRAREQEARIEREIVVQLGEMGCLGGELPEAYGGSGLDCVTSGIIVEEIARGDFNVAYLPLLASLIFPSPWGCTTPTVRTLLSSGESTLV